MIKNNETISIIRSLVIASRRKTRGSSKRFDQLTDDNGLYNCEYLLGQTLRQYNLPMSQKHISQAFKDLWESITSYDCNRIEYDMRFQCDRLLDDKQVNAYAGNSTQPKKGKLILKPGGKYKYNSIFIDEHIVPISIIKKDLFSLCDRDELSDDSIQAVLNKIHICKITKDENARIISSSNRSSDYRNVIDNDYKNAGITVLNWDENKKMYQ